MILTNKNGPWQYQNQTWEKFPAEGIPGLMQNSNGSVLGLSNDGTDSGTVVVLEPFDIDRLEFQIWTREKTYKDGYFTLINPVSGGYLTASGSSNTTIEGM